jgi:hypothetical protein
MHPAVPALALLLLVHVASPAAAQEAPLPDFADHVVVEGSAEDTWPRVRAAFDELDLPITEESPGDMLVRSMNQRLRRIGSQPVSRFFQCAGAFGNSASLGDVFVSVQSRVVATGEEPARLRTVAEARVRSGGSWVECRSNGRLESLIGRRVQERTDPDA